MKFNIRDLLWAMLVVGLAIGWWIDRRQIESRADKLQARVHQLEAASRKRKEFLRSLYGQATGTRLSDVVRQSGVSSSGEIPASD
jgi:hypothetical protein